MKITNRLEEKFITDLENEIKNTTQENYYIDDFDIESPEYTPSIDPSKKQRPEKVVQSINPPRKQSTNNNFNPEDTFRNKEFVSPEKNEYKDIRENNKQRKEIPSAQTPKKKFHSKEGARAGGKLPKTKSKKALVKKSPKIDSSFEENPYSSKGSPEYAHNSYSVDEKDVYLGVGNTFESSQNSSNNSNLFSKPSLHTRKKSPVIQPSKIKTRPDLVTSQTPKPPITKGQTTSGRSSVGTNKEVKQAPMMLKNSRVLKGGAYINSKNSSNNKSVIVTGNSGLMTPTANTRAKIDFQINTHRGDIGPKGGSTSNIYISEQKSIYIYIYINILGQLSEQKYARNNPLQESISHNLHPVKKDKLPPSGQHSRTNTRTSALDLGKLDGDMDIIRVAQQYKYELGNYIYKYIYIYL